MVTWEWCHSRGLSYITLPKWQEQGLTVAITARTGGLSKGDYASLNLALHVGDDKETVLANRERLASALSISLSDMVAASQVHKTNVAVVTGHDRGRGMVDNLSPLPETDAMVTDCEGIFLTAFFADCVPILLFDPRRRVVGLVHSGWKGTMGRIAQGAVRVMQEQFGSRPSDIQVFLGPAIGGCCYEVDSSLADRVVNTLHVDAGYLVERRMGRSYWHLVRTNYHILEISGIPRQNMEASGICTRCNQSLFYSHRGSGGRTGRFAVVLGLNKR